VFRALYTQSGLREAGGTFVVTPKGTPCFTAPTLGEIARQISHHEHPGPPAARG
jgi:hypothetical protein